MVARELAADGANNHDIAERLSLSFNTVKTHMRNILGKTECRDRTELAVALARRRLTVRVAPPVRPK